MRGIRVVSLALLLLFILNNTAESAKGYGDGEQDWGYVDVREGAHMFYWLYYTTANVASFTERPLAIWLQGGPGASSTGYGNFEELGPLTLDGEKREWTWVKDLNVLFIDNPVGSGFSYVDDKSFYAKTNKQIALDLVEFMKGFYKKHPQFEKVPLHIFCESYGGKMSPEFALELYRAIKRGEIRSNLKSVLLGDPWTSPVDSVMAWGDLLLNTGVVDYEGYNKTMVATNKVKEYVEKGQWNEATEEWRTAEDVVRQVTTGVDWYNIERKTLYLYYEYNDDEDDSNKENLKKKMNKSSKAFLDFELDNDNDLRLEVLMRGPVTKALQPKSLWGAQSGEVFDALSVDFMKPAVDIVVELLDTTDLQVGILTGQLDLICATMGTVKFVENMQWSYKKEYTGAKRTSIAVNDVLEGYQKTAKNFTFFWALRAGHMVPADNPKVMDYILKYYTKYDQSELKPSFL